MDAPFFKLILDDLNDGVYLVDVNRCITYWNRGAERLTGFEARQILYRPCHAGLLSHVDGNGRCLCQDGCPLAGTLQDGIVREAQLFLRHRDGHRVPVHVRVSPLRNAAGEICGAVETFSDASAYASTLEQLRQLEAVAMLDPLTQLPNRRYMEVRLQSRLEELRRFGWPMGVIVADLDHFKQINDTYGHDIGDQALKMVARTLAATTRGLDVVGRWGGDEFVGILANLQECDLLTIAERLRALVGQCSLRVEPTPLTLTISLGAAMADPEDTAETVLKKADLALYQSKRAGRNRTTTHIPSR